MKNLISPEEAEIASEIHAKPILKHLLPERNREARKHYIAGVQAANTKYSDTVVPVLDQAAAALKVFNFRDTTEEKPIAWETGNWDGKRSDFLLCIDKTGQHRIGRVYTGRMDGSDFTDFYDRDDYEFECAFWMYLPGHFEAAHAYAALSQLNELTK